MFCIHVVPDFAAVAMNTSFITINENNTIDTSHIPVGDIGMTLASCNFQQQTSVEIVLYVSLQRRRSVAISLCLHGNAYCKFAYCFPHTFDKEMNHKRIMHPGQRANTTILSDGFGAHRI